MDERHLIYRIIEYGLKNQFFTLEKLETDLRINEEESNYIQKTFVSLHTVGESGNPNHLMNVLERTVVVNGKLDYKKNKLALLPTAIFQYNDYLEIIEARKNAEYAKTQSNRANALSRWALILTIVIGLLQIGIAIYFGKN